MPLRNWGEFGDGRSITDSRRYQVNVVSMQKGEQQHRISTIQSFGENLSEELFVEKLPREFGGHHDLARPTTKGFYDIVANEAKIVSISFSLYNEDVVESTPKMSP